MKLTEEQIQQFDTEGYVFLPSCFSKEEIAVLNDAATEIYASEREEVWRESSGIARTAFAAHTYNCLLYTSPSPRDRTRSRMPSSA